MNKNAKNKLSKKSKLFIIIGSGIALLVLAMIIIQFTAFDKATKNVSTTPTDEPTVVPIITPTYIPTVTPKTSPKISPTDSITEAPVISTMNVHFIDVEQGDSILIETNGHYMLIDAGQNDKGSAVVKYLKGLGVEKLDYVISTHPHNDHIGGLDTVLDTFKIGDIIMPKVTYNSEALEEVLEVIDKDNLPILNAVVGNNYSLGDASFVIISPHSTSYESLNDNSVGIKLTYGTNSFLLTGDAQEISEEEMIKNDIDLSADVIKLSHHGSSTSSSSSFLDNVNPKYAIISVGTGNKYEHPHSETMQAMEDRKTNVYRTDEQGTVIFTSDGKSISVNVDPYVVTTSDLTSDAAEEAAKSKGY